MNSKYEFGKIPCHNCGGMMIPEVHVIVDYVVEVRWTCNKCGAVRGGDRRTIDKWLNIFVKMGLVKPITSATWEII